MVISVKVPVTMTDVQSLQSLTISQTVASWLIRSGPISWRDIIVMAIKSTHLVFDRCDVYTSLKGATRDTRQDGQPVIVLTY